MGIDHDLSVHAACADVGSIGEGRERRGGNGVWNPWNKPAGSECTVLRSQNRNYRVYDVVMVRDLWLEIVAVSFVPSNQSEWRVYEFHTSFLYYNR